MEKWFGVVLFLLSAYEPVYGQCFLSIGLTQFQNLYSLEIRPGWNNGPFCCCDHSTCNNNADQFSLNTCESLCDTYFVLSFSECHNLEPCPVAMITDVSKDSNTTATINYEFHFNVSITAIEQVAFEIEMRDDDGNSFREIDTFDITATFSSDNQEQVFTGNRGIANITLTYDLICIEPDTCEATASASELIDSCAVIDTTTSVITSMQIINSTSITFTTSTIFEVQSVNKTATVSTVVTISAMPRAITVTRFMSANSSPGGSSVGEQSAGSSDSITIIWMLLFILFAFLSIVAVMINIYFAYLLKKKSKFKVDSNAGNVTLAQTNLVAPMDNPVYGSQGTSGKNDAVNVHAAPSQEVYSTLANDLYADESASTMHNYSMCGPVESQNDESYEYVQTRKLEKSEAAPYEVPISLATSK